MHIICCEELGGVAMKKCIGIFPDINYKTNQIQVNKNYIRGIVNAGALPVILPYLDEDLTSKQLAQVDGVLLTGGDDISPLLINEEPMRMIGDVNPYRDEIELHIAKYCLKQSIPILGVCKGMQVMAIACGGKVYQDIYLGEEERLEHKQTAPGWAEWHSIKLVPSTKLYDIFDNKDKIAVNSFHHQGVKSVIEPLRVCARSEDNLIEAFEHTDHPFYIGVQWHPERMIYTPLQQNIFNSFIKSIYE